MNKKIVFLGAAILIGVAAFFFRSNRGETPVPVEPVEEASVATAPTPVSSPHTAPPSRGPVAEHDRKLVGELTQILASRNDNDPRLDSDFRGLTPGTKELLREKYQTLAAEARNERGTIVFLIGRELNRPEDCEFLASVTSEPPCLNLSDCKKAPSHSDEDIHEEAANSVTLAYPQHVAVKSMENFLNRETHDPALRETCLNALSKMTESPVAPIAKKAEALEEHFRH